MAKAYYNEIDPFAANWLRALIAADLIADGDVDERSIEDVKPSDLTGYTQCHFFAGIGGWSRALRLAGWPDNRPVWTGSCPCQPFSAAGKGEGFADERHLWPAFNHLINVVKPDAVLGEQVASKPGLAWFDIVSSDLEAAGYSCGAVDICAAGVGAPHIRQRLYFGAHALFTGRSERGSIPGDGPAAGSGSVGVGTDAFDSQRLQRGDVGHGADGGRKEARDESGTCGQVLGGVGSDAHGSRRGTGRTGQESDGFGEARKQPSGLCSSGVGTDADGRIASDRNVQRGGEHGLRPKDREIGERCDGVATGLQGQRGDERDGNKPGWLSEEQARSIAASGATRGFWAGCDWWYGRDEKFRPAQSKLLALADELPSRVGNLCESSSAEEKTKEEKTVDGKETENRSSQALLGVPTTDDSQTVQRKPGRHDELPETQILQSTMHGNGSDQRTTDGTELQPFTGAQDAQGMVRTLPRTSDACSPSGRRPSEQFSREFTKFVLLVSPSIALAELSGDTFTKSKLQGLLTAEGENRILRNSSDSFQKVWRSLSTESQNRLRLGFESGRFVRVGESPLAHGVSGRMGKLRGYGNAIVPTLAAEFIKTFVEAVEESR